MKKTVIELSYTLYHHKQITLQVAMDNLENKDIFAGHKDVSTQYVEEVDISTQTGDTKILEDPTKASQTNSFSSNQSQTINIQYCCNKHFYIL